MLDLLLPVRRCLSKLAQILELRTGSHRKLPVCLWVESREGWCPPPNWRAPVLQPSADGCIGLTGGWPLGWLHI